MKQEEFVKLLYKIADVPYEYAHSEPDGRDLWLQDRSNQSVNPFFNQTKSGVYLELYYGIPGHLWTPWGRWDCWGSGMGNFDKVIENILSRLGAIEYKPEVTTEMGVFGPVYELTQVDGIDLPKAEIRNKSEYLSYDQAKSEWENLKNA